MSVVAGPRSPNSIRDAPELAKEHLHRCTPSTTFREAGGRPVVPGAEDAVAHHEDGGDGPSPGSLRVGVAPSDLVESCSKELGVAELVLAVQGQRSKHNAGAGSACRTPVYRYARVLKETNEARLPRTVFV